MPLLRSETGLFITPSVIINGPIRRHYKYKEIPALEHFIDNSLFALYTKLYLVHTTNIINFLLFVKSSSCHHSCFRWHSLTSFYHFYCFSKQTIYEFKTKIKSFWGLFFVAIQLSIVLAEICTIIFVRTGAKNKNTK